MGPEECDLEIISILRENRCRACSALDIKQDPEEFYTYITAQVWPVFLAPKVLRGHSRGERVPSTPEARNARRPEGRDKVLQVHMKYTTCLLL